MQQVAKQKNPMSQEPPVSAYVKLIRTAEALHNEVSRGLTPDGLTASQFSTLKVLKLRGAIPQKEIANYLLKTGGNVTVVVDNLERQGWVKRERDTLDRRLVLVSLSPAGEALFDRIYPHHLQRIRTAMKGLSIDEQGTLRALLEKLYSTTGELLCSSPDEECIGRAAS